MNKFSTVQYVNAVVRLLGQQYLLVASDYIYSFIFCFQHWIFQVNKNISKIEKKIPLKTSTSFSSPWRTSHCSTNASSFPLYSSMALSKTCVSNAWGSPRGVQMPSSRATIKLRLSHPQEWQQEQIPRGCPGGMGTAGIERCITLSLGGNFLAHVKN